MSSLLVSIKSKVPYQAYWLTQLSQWPIHKEAAVTQQAATLLPTPCRRHKLPREYLRLLNQIIYSVRMNSKTSSS